MVSTGIYVRVSTEEQAKEGYSIRAQEEKLRAFATLKDWNIYSVYADEGISGKDIDGRPAIKQMIADITSGKVNNVLVYKIDRLTRSTKNLIELVELFNRQQCAFNSLQESIDTSSATGRMFIKIVGIFAEFERENLAERVRFGLERKAKEGYVLCNYSPSFGYVRENGDKVQRIDESEAAIVRRIFDMYLNGDYNYSQISDMLIAENVPTKKGGQWVQTTIRQILTNPNYIGKVRYGMDDVTRYFEADGHHEPIIDETTYYQVQDKIGKTKRVSRTKQPRSDVYFCGLLYCKTCGGKYTTHWNHKRGIAFASYGGMIINEDCCKSKTISHKKVEAAFERYIANIEDLSTLSNNTEISAPPDNSTEIATIAAEIKQIEKKTEEIMSLFVGNTIDFETYQGMVKLSNERRGELQARLILLENAQAAQDVSFTAADIVMNFRENWAALDNEQRQAFLQKFIKKIVIHSEKAADGYHNEVIIDDVIFNKF
ncbi:recombinase family protein [Oscillospiraceae bacterium OttesenSCG-928-G22]|nr:recombinase family protein [Oscillospiraceae bacterium OttesenSCG-928-G22]